MSPCPNDEQLEAYRRNASDEGAQAAIARHVDRCPSCRDRLKELDADESLALAAKRAMDAPIETAGLETQQIGRGSVSADIPAVIGQYHMKRLIASGGMGSVYEAVQQSPRRTVAVKVIKKGIASRSAMRRFVHESQILARLRHPGIAQVFEAGIHGGEGDGVPFFAMEYIPGARSITAFAADRNLGTRERLGLFAQVCDAAHHGHQKGVIHRDLKPSNILVDNGGQLKIIDFGVARSTDADVALTTMQTEVGQLVGTLQYMSPEQCDADPNDIDVRSDVYALGLILYELLCGKPPYDISRVPVYEATRVIREQEPSRLSTIDRTLRGDIETIALKALEKDRDRRYRSAAQLGDDIRRYLSGDGITARPPTLAYQLRVFGRKHRALVAASASVFVVLIAALVETSILYQRAHRARVLAEQGQAQAKAVTDFLTETLSSIDPERAAGGDVTVREMVDKTAAEIEGAFRDQPLVEAGVRATLGRTYMALAAYPAADQHLRAALKLRKDHLAEGSLPIAESLWLMGQLHYYKGEYPEAEAHYRKALAIRKPILGERHEAVAACLDDLGLALLMRHQLRDAHEALTQALAIRKERFGGRHALVAESMNNVALAFIESGRVKEALELYRQVIDIESSIFGDYHPNVAVALGNIAAIHRDFGDLKSAETSARRAIEIALKVYPPRGHAKLALYLNILGSVLVRHGPEAEAEQVLLKSCRMYESLYSDLPAHTARPFAHLATLYARQNRNEEATSMLQRAIAITKSSLGDNHPEVKNLSEKLKALQGQREARSGVADR